MKNFEDMSNKDFAFACLEKLKSQGKLTSATLALLTDPDQCHDRFHCSSGFAVLMEVPANCSDEELKKLCHFGAKRRYYQDRFTADGRTFVVVNHWYGPNRTMPDNRTPFMDWVNSVTD